MVRASLRRSTSGIAEIFRDRDFKAIALTGAVAAGGAVLSATVASTFNVLLGFGSFNNRQSYAVLALTAALVGMAAVKYGGPAWGGGVAVGSVGVIGMAGLAFLLQDNNPIPDTPSTMSVNAMTGASQPVNASLPRGAPRNVGHDPAVPLNGFR